MCRLAKFLYWVIPLNVWRAFLIEKHFALCPKCSAETGVVDRCVGGLFDRQGWIAEEASLWPSVRDRLASRKDRPAFARPPRPRTFASKNKAVWAAASAAFLLIAGLSVLLWVGRRGEPSAGLMSLAGGPHQIKVVSATFKGRKAQTFIYQTASSSFIWISPAKAAGGKS
jgi:hypothetical protein